MDKNIKLGDLTFEPYFSEEQIRGWVKAVADKLNADYAGKSNVILIGVLNGAFMFMADLVRLLTFQCEIDFVKASSYVGTESAGKAKLNLEMKNGVKGKHVVLVEDILDTGLTLSELRKFFVEKLEPASFEICVFWKKQGKLKHDVVAKYIGLEIPHEFIVGYGLDYDEMGRQLKSIYRKVG